IDGLREVLYEGQRELTFGRLATDQRPRLDDVEQQLVEQHQRRLALEQRDEILAARRSGLVAVYKQRIVCLPPSKLVGKLAPKRGDGATIHLASPSRIEVLAGEHCEFHRARIGQIVECASC